MKPDQLKTALKETCIRIAVRMDWMSVDYARVLFTRDRIHILFTEVNDTKIDKVKFIAQEKYLLEFKLVDGRSKAVRRFVGLLERLQKATRRRTLPNEVLIQFMTRKGGTQWDWQPKYRELPRVRIHRTAPPKGLADQQTDLYLKYPRKMRQAMARIQQQVNLDPDLSAYRLPEGIELATGDEPSTSFTFFVLQKPWVTSADFKDTRVEYRKDGSVHLWIVLTAQGRKNMREFSSGNIGRTMAILCNGSLQSAPTILSKLDTIEYHLELGQVDGSHILKHMS